MKNRSHVRRVVRSAVVSPRDHRFDVYEVSPTLPDPNPARNKAVSDAIAQYKSEREGIKARGE